MNDIHLHVARLCDLREELVEAIMNYHWDEVLTITSQMKFHLREIDNYARKLIPSVHY